ncbi:MULTISPECIES: hypothetical protein [Rhizobium]|uniref:hypothetical protein n=1 Tax=Rhizobium TaxID=379 RepID=UPI00102F50D5|nr:MULTISPECIES: hypothetical protein [Rhizobium]MBY5826330.1 hypothetical protein [Rhizobium leguminosarum]TBA44960.1 hypothetical protein ELH62_22440 [Rhizobium ruizarguesonis]
MKKLFAPKEQSISGVYRTDTKEKIYSFAVLAHATIEEYIENEVLLIAKTARDKFNASGHVSVPLLAMLCRREGSEIGFSDDVFSISGQKQLATVVSTSFIQCESRIGKNHGVRKPNVAKMFMSIGFPPSGACEAVLSSLDAFGHKRGEYAHKSPTATLLQETDPYTEAQETLRLIDELEVLDDELSEFKLLQGL